MKRTVRFAISVLLLVALALAVNWQTIPRYLRNLQPWAAFVVIPMLALQLVVSAWKWRWALRIHELHFRLGYLVRVYCIGFFLNNFLPSSIGGDGYRVFRTLPDAGFKSTALSAVLLERLVGVAALIVLGACGAVQLYSAHLLARAYLTIVLAVTAVIVISIWAIKQRRVGFLRASLQKSTWYEALKHNVRHVARARGAWLPLLAISLLFQAQAVLIIFVLFEGLGVHVSFAQAVLITAAAGLATVIPLSINGLGIVEASLAGAAVALGVGYEEGLLVSVLIRIFVLPLSLLAGLLYLFESAEKHPLASASDTSLSRVIAALGRAPRNG
jgi:uncharacterized protein (TIRG00374 family)